MVVFNFYDILDFFVLRFYFTLLVTSGKWSRKISALQYKVCLITRCLLKLLFMFIRNFFVKFLLCSTFTMREKCPDSEFFWAVFLRFRTPNAGKCKPEELQIRTLFKQCYSRHFNLDVSS